MSAQLKVLIDEVSGLVHKATGVQLGSNQTSMVQFRLSKRMNDLQLKDPEDYRNFIHTNLDAELKVLISLLTTHHTFFFREYGHFEHLEREVLPRMIEELRKEGRKTIRVWSAASSRGQEVYTLSMFLSVHLKKLAPDFTYEILGSDVDHESVEIGKNGVYRWDEIKEIPSAYLMNNWIRGTAEIADFAKAKANIKDKTRFKTINLFEVTPENPSGQFDIIFCRNVFIYFKPDQITSISRSLLSHLSKTGVLYLGMSESLNGLKLPAALFGPSCYAHEDYVKQVKSPKAAAPTKSSATTKAATPASPAPVAARSGPLRILCVDDSGTVLVLLKKILTAADGFEVVATAENGLKAAEVLKTTKVDAMTLDIHMPEQDGVEYLKKNFKAGHPPVVMISSVSREDSSLGLKALEYGASDYVEKPSLQNLTQRGEEIRMKLRLAVNMAQTSSSDRMQLAESFKKDVSLKNVDNKLRVVIGGLGDRDRLKKFLYECKNPQPATLVLMHGSDALLPSLTSAWNGAFGPVEYVSEVPKNPTAGKIYVGDFSKIYKSATAELAKLKTSVVIFGDATSEMATLVPSWNNAQLIVEDRSGLSKAHATLKEIASYCVPVTSMKYHSDEYLGEAK